MRTYSLFVTQDRDGLWYFYLCAPNGKIVMSSHQGYAKQSNARRAALRLAIIFESHAVALPEPQ